MGDSEMSEPSTSKGKRRRIEVKNPKNITEEELLRILEDSDIEDCDFNSEGSYVPSDYELSSDEDEGNQTTLTVDEIGISEGSTNIVDNSDVWNDFCMGMKQIDFQKTPGFLVAIPENASPYDYF
nr:uncharacterized protein LOC111509454 [Leptinotarsa decemlineata]